MSPIKETQGRAVHSAASGRTAIPDVFVLPRFLRRPVRFISSLAAGRVPVPAHAGSVSAACFLALTGLYGMSLGGHTGNVTEALTTGAGFALEDVHISGNRETSDIDILGQLGLSGTTSTIAVDVHQARSALKALPWVEDATVAKVYPTGLAITLVERQPAAIWQHGDDLTLIDAAGKPIAPLTGSRHAGLPLYVGLGADEKAGELEAELLFHPEIRNRVKAAIRVGARRWDLRLDNGVTIKLPEGKVSGALDRLAEFDRGRGVADRDIVAIDLRLDDRVTLQLSEAAMERRRLAVEARDKALKAGKRT